MVMKAAVTEYLGSLLFLFHSEVREDVPQCLFINPTIYALSVTYPFRTINHTGFVFILTAITTVLTVPRGSWNILIEEVSPSNNTLSMQAKITVYLQNSHGFNWPFFSTLFQSSATTTLMEMRIPIWALISMLGWVGLGGIITRTPERVKC